MDALIPVALPWLGEPEAEAARRPILSGWVMQGPEVAAFEAEFAAHVGARHACAVSSCTTALHLGLLAVGVGPGDEVITASHSFVATANSVRYCGAKPVFVDIQPGTFNLDPELVERAITPSTRAILCVHQIGMPCDLVRISAIARRHGLSVVEDCACAAGSEILWNGEWQKIGRPQGDVACFSFHPRKVITTGDGGMVTTNRADWDELFHLLRLHGMTLSTAQRHGARTVAFESYDRFGYNYQTRDFNYVSDTARAILSAGLRTEAIGRVMNIGSGRETSVNELARAVIDVVGNPRVEVLHDAPRPADIARMCANGARAREIIDYAPDVPLAAGLTRLKEWYVTQESTPDGLLSDECVHNWDRDELDAAASKTGDRTPQPV